MLVHLVVIALEFIIDRVGDRGDLKTLLMVLRTGQLPDKVSVEVSHLQRVQREDLLHEDFSFKAVV